MPPRSQSLPRLLMAIFGLAAVGVRAELLKVSPFLPPQGAANSPTANAPLEYRGSIDVGETEQYRIADPARKVGIWLKVGEKDANLDVTVRQHDRDTDSIVVEHGGQTLTLQLHSAKVVSSGATAQILPSPLGQSQPNVSPAITQTVVLNPTQADEQRRLEAVAAEVARRRALREQAAQAAAGNPGPPPQPMVSRQDMQQLYLQQQQQNAARARR